MKKNTVKLFMLALMLGSGIIAHSQDVKGAKVAISQTDAKRMQEVATELKREYAAKYDEAVKLAKINNWPLEIKKDDGNISMLTEVRDGVPFYTGTHNVGSALTSRTNHLQPGGSLGLELTGAFDDGEYMVVGVWDGGYARTLHNDLIGRLSTGDTDGEIAYHPTHVTGTIIGSGASAANSKGMAPGAHVVNYTYGADAGEMEGFALFGYTLSNHSYGIDQSQFPESYLQLYRGTYDDLARGVDKITFDAPYYQPVYAAGNDGNGVSYDILTDRSVSKNGIAVAAVNQVNNYTDETSVVAASFTSFGPTNDNRIKPDIATKGTNVYSTSHQNNTAHAYEQGTSMAAPGITGSLTLLQQYYANLHSTAGTKTFMRSSTVRALVAHCADEAGLAPGPDPVYGYGLMNSKRAAEIIKADHENGSAKIQELILTPGQTFTYNVTASGTEPLIATLAWTDPPANATNNGSSTSVLINNLDIKVTKGGETHYPWRLGNDGSYTAVNDGANNVDNIEKVEVPGASGTYTITITHKKSTLVNPNGTPQQAYSLVVSGINGIPAGVEDFTDKMFSVWPNPANDVLNISFRDGVEKNASASIYDIQGRLVRNVALTGADNQLDVQGLSKGVYVVSVTNGSKTDVQKVVIK